MTPLQTSAQFAAYLWFLKQEKNLGKTTDDAQAYARQNWDKFLPAANEGFGRLIEAIAKPPVKPSRPKSKANAKARLAVA